MDPTAVYHRSDRQKKLADRLAIPIVAGYTPAPLSAFFGGTDIGGTKIHAIVAAGDGTIRARARKRIKGVRVELSHLGDDVVALGAVAYAKTLGAAGTQKKD